MKRTWALMFLGLCGVAPAAAQPFDLDWYTIDGGGGLFSAAGTFEVSGTIGQPDAGLTAMTGGTYELSGGFWPGIVAGEDCLGDLNEDGSIDLGDLSILLVHFGAAGEYADGDLNGDGQVDLADLSILLTRFGESCS